MLEAKVKRRICGNTVVVAAPAGLDLAGMGILVRRRRRLPGGLSVAIALLSIAYTTSASAQCIDLYCNGGITSGADGNEVTEFIQADDFSLTGSGTITGAARKRSR